jgi:biopolymer transport protein ExbD
MAMAIPEVEETTLNMTPMIDIVFQLVTFFLLTLHFSTPEDRLESQLPKDRGLAATPTIVKDFQNIKVKLFRRNKENKDEAYTLIRVGNNWEIALPKGQWPEDTQAEDARIKEYDKVYAALGAHIKEEWAKQGNSEEVHGEVAAPPPNGGAVPHGEAVRVLDTFLDVGILLVNFEGQIAPLSSAEGGTMYR